MRRLRAIAALLLSLALAVPARAQDVDPDRAAGVKAAYVVNFLRYTQWPATAFSGPAAAYRVVVLGDEAVARALRETARRPVLAGDRPLDVITADPTDDGTLPHAHLVYFGAGVPHGTLVRLLATLPAQGVLTVGDGPGFCRDGGMLGLVLNDGRIVFDANSRAILSSPLVVSAKVMKLARVIEESPR